MGAQALVVTSDVEVMKEESWTLTTEAPC
jgi:hypothetical protein